MTGMSCRLVNTSIFSWSIACCDMHPARSLSTLWCRKIFENWLSVRSLMFGLSFLSFYRLKFFVCLVALSLPCEGTYIIYCSSYKKKFFKKIARNQYTTTQNKPLVISEGCHDNFEPNKIFKSLGCTGMMDLNGDLEFRWHRKWRTKRAMSCGWLGSFNRNPLAIYSRDRK